MKIFDRGRSPAFQVGDYDHERNGYPILVWGECVAVSVYRGGTGPALEAAEEIVEALTKLGKKTEFRSY